MTDVLYLYGFVPAAAPAPPAALTGVGNAPVELLPLGPVQAVFSRVPAREYGAESVSVRLEDMAWVGEQGLAHERVVLWFVDEADILPARLFTLYSSTAALEEAIGPRLPLVSRQLTALAGRREWNLKVASDRNELARHGAEVSPAVRELDEEMAVAPPGRRYLLQRQRADLLKRELGRAASRLAGELLERIAAHAEASRVLPPAAADAGGTVVLTAALLVAREAESAWRDAADPIIEHYRRLGLIITLSGPWAPYRFLEPEADA